MKLIKKIYWRPGDLKSPGFHLYQKDNRVKYSQSQEVHKGLTWFVPHMNIEKVEIERIMWEK
jgi:hypothetical protein